MLKLPEEQIREKFEPQISMDDDGDFLGFESLYLRKFGLWTVAKLEVALRKNHREKPLAIEFGGGSGYFAMRLARLKINVVIIDRVKRIDHIEREKIISLRNARLQEESPTNGIIRSYDANLTDLTPKDLRSFCGEQSPELLIAQRIMHCLTSPQLRHFFGLASGIITEGKPLLEHDSIRHAHNPSF